MAPAASQSVLKCRDEDMTDMCHVAKVQRTDRDEYELVSNLVTESQSDQFVEIKATTHDKKMIELFKSVEMFWSKNDTSVKPLKDKMEEGFKRKDCENLEAKIIVKMEQRFKNEENARQLAQMKQFS